MKRLLVLVVALSTTSQVARADVIGLYTDAFGTSCSFRPGFTNTASVIHKFSTGMTGSHFAVNFPPGTNVISFASPYTVLGDITTDITIQYDACLTGFFLVGTVTANLATGFINVVTAAGYPTITVTDCDNVEHPAGGNVAGVGDAFRQVNCNDPQIAIEASTWGAVKSLYH